MRFSRVSEELPSIAIVFSLSEFMFVEDSSSLSMRGDEGVSALSELAAPSSSPSGHLLPALEKSHSKPKHAPVGRLVRPAIGKVIKGFFGHADNVVFHELGTFARTVFGMLQGAFPFDHGPSREIIRRHL